jgi:hypothetical protein
MKEIEVKEGLRRRILLPEHLFIIWEFSRLLFKKMNNDEYEEVLNGQETL